MPNINDAFPSKFLKSSDLQGKEPVVTIAKVVMEEVGQNKEMKPVVYFSGAGKGLVLNKTNANRIVQITGTGVTEEWRGHKIKLYATETSFNGEQVDCIRIRPSVPSKSNPLRPAPVKTKPAPEPEPEPQHDDEQPAFDNNEPPLTDDDIPF